MALRHRSLVGACGVFSLAIFGCGDRPTDPGPLGPATVTIVAPSPTEANGAALLEIAGAGSASALDAHSEVRSEVFGTTTRVLILREAPGELRFRFTPSEGSHRGTITIVEIAGPDNTLREDLSRYQTAVTR